MIDEKTVEKIARLSRLSLSPQEIQEYSKHLSAILVHFEELANVNTDGVAPLVTPSHIDVHLREDELKHELTADDALKNAPERSGHLFKVPPVI